MNEYFEKQTSTLFTIRQVILLFRMIQKYATKILLFNFFDLQESKLELPALVICPKNADAIDGDSIVRQISQALPAVDNITASSVLQFAIAGFGFSNMEASQSIKKQIIRLRF